LIIIVALTVPFGKIAVALLIFDARCGVFVSTNHVHLLLKHISCGRIVDHFELAIAFNGLDLHLAWAGLNFNPAVTLLRQLSDDLIGY
jgi:hypothetical protein